MSFVHGLRPEFRFRNGLYCVRSVTQVTTVLSQDSSDTQQYITATYRVSQKVVP